MLRPFFFQVVVVVAVVSVVVAVVVDCGVARSLWLTVNFE